MSILLDDSASERFTDTANGPGITAQPFTFGAWVKPDASVSNQVFISISDTGGTGDYWAFRLNTTNNPVQCLIVAAAGTSSAVSANSAWAVDTWVHCCFVEAAANSHTTFADGVAGTTQTTSRIPGSIDHFAIGALVHTSAITHFSGRILWPFAYSINLTAAEVLRLANGANPHSVRQDKLVEFGRDMGDVFLDDTRRTTFAVNGTPEFSNDNPLKAQRVGPRSRGRDRGR